MRIRRSLETDWSRVKEIEDQAIHCYYRAGFAKDEVLPRTEEDIRFLIAHTQSVVVEDAGQVVGYMSYYQIGPYLHLEEHVVDEGYWRQGVGTELLHHFLQAGVEIEDCLYYSLLVFPEAHWAWNCYLRTGFRTVDVDQIEALEDASLLRMMEGELKLRSLGRGRVLMIKER